MISQDTCPFSLCSIHHHNKLPTTKLAATESQSPPVAIWFWHYFKSLLGYSFDVSFIQHVTHDVWVKLPPVVTLGGGELGAGEFVELVN